MKFNPLEIIGWILLLSGALWLWHEGNAGAGLGAVEAGIFCLIGSALLSGFSRKEK